MADRIHRVTLGKDAGSGTLCILSFLEHELLLKYEINNKETKNLPLHTEEVDSSSVQPHQLEQQEVREIVEPQPTRQPQIISLSVSKSVKAKKSADLPASSEKKTYQELIDLILQIPDMRQFPQARNRLLPKNLRVRHSRSEKDPAKDLENIIDLAERFDALPKVFSNLWIELDNTILEDGDGERNRLREELNEIRSALSFQKRKIRMEYGQIPNECRRFLRSKLNAYFDLEGIRTICYDLAIEYESLKGPAKSGIVISLLEEVERQHRINEFIEICKSVRPHIDWDC